jgi:hypothetical protein
MTSVSGLFRHCGGFLKVTSPPRGHRPFGSGGIHLNTTTFMETLNFLFFSFPTHFIDIASQVKRNGKGKPLTKILAL